MESRLVMVEEEELEMRPPVKVKRPDPDRVRRVELLDTVRAEVEAILETERKVEVALVVVELREERLVTVEVELLTSIPPEKVEREEAVTEVRDCAPVTVMASGISESVRPETPETVALLKVTPLKESSFWVRVIILTLPSVREEREEMEEDREAN